MHDNTEKECSIIMERSLPRSRIDSLSPLRSEPRSLSPSRLHPSPLPTTLTSHRFAVHSTAGMQGVGYVCRAYGRGYRAVGFGTLIAPGVIVTSRAVIHTEESASRSVIQLSKRELAMLKPEILFLSIPELRISLVGTEIIASKPIDIIHRFTLERNAVARHILTSKDVSRVKMVESQRFFFQSEVALLAGTPVFDQDWHFQGLTVTPSTSSGYNEALKVDSLLSALLERGHLLRHIAGLKTLIGAIYFAPKAPESEGEEHILWFEWLSGLIHSYCTLSGKWSAIAPVEAEYLWGSKVIELPDGSYLLVGGVKEQRAAVQVLCYTPSLAKVTRVADLLTGRVACGLAYCLGIVYVIGGENTAGSCECYPLQTMQWNYISSLQVAREAINAAAMGNRVYVVGGLPLREAGRSVERYGLGVWKRLPLSLPEPVCNSALVAVDGDMLAILGGRHSKRVFLLHVSSAPLSPYNSPSLQECPSFPLPLETQYPAYSSSRTALLYIFNSHESQHKPWVVTYPKVDLYQRKRDYVKRTASRLLPNLGIR